MSPLTLFGFVAVGAMLVFYALEDRAPIVVLYFALACLLSSAYGFLQGAWPFGIVEAVWSVVALRRWRSRIQSGHDGQPRAALAIACDMSAFTPAERRSYHDLRARISAGIGETVETPHGFLARIADASSPAEIAEWLALERRCCPFLDVGLELRQDRSIWIRIDGPLDAKAFLADEFAELRHR